MWFLLIQMLCYKHCICFSCKHKPSLLLFFYHDGFKDDGLKLTCQSVHEQFNYSKLPQPALYQCQSTYVTIVDTGVEEVSEH